MLWKLVPALLWLAFKNTLLNKHPFELESRFLIIEWVFMFKYLIKYLKGLRFDQEVHSGVLLMMKQWKTLQTGRWFVILTRGFLFFSFFLFFRTVTFRVSNHINVWVAESVHYNNLLWHQQKKHDLFMTTANHLLQFIICYFSDGLTDGLMSKWTDWVLWDIDK